MCCQGIGALTVTRPAAGLVLTGSDEVEVLSASTSLRSGDWETGQMTIGKRGGSF